MKNIINFIKKNKQSIKSLIGVFLIVSFFIFFSYYTKQNEEYIRKIIVNDSYGIAVYFFMMVFETIISPLSFLPLVAVASNLWGWVITGFINWSAWVLGSALVFLLARYYGKGFISKFVPEKALLFLGSRISERYMFFSVVLWSIIIPSDLVAYFFGILTNIKFRTYIIASILGVAPFSFLLAYLGVLPTKVQIFIFLIFFTLLIIAFFIRAIHIKFKNKIANSSFCR